MNVEADHDPTSTRSWQSVAAEVTAHIAADVREWWRHPKRTAVAATLQVAWIIIADVAICFGLGELWFRCWYSPADLSADQLGFARTWAPSDQAAWWDDDQRFYHRNTFRALQTQWVWRECPVSLIACVLVTYLCKIWPRLQARLGGLGRQLVYITQRVLLAPPDHLVRNFNDRNPRWRLRWTLRCWLGIAVHYVLRKLSNPSLSISSYDVTEYLTWDSFHFEFPRPCWKSAELRRGSFTLATVLRSLRPAPSQAEPNTVTEPDKTLNPDALIYRIDRDRLVEQNSQWDTAWDERAWARALEHQSNSCQKESNETARHLKDRDQTIRTSEQRLKSCQEERDDAVRHLKDRDQTIRTSEQRLKSCQEERDDAVRHLKDRDRTIRTLEQRLKSCQGERDDAARDLKDIGGMLTRTLKRRWELITNLGQRIENVGEYVTRHIPYVEADELSRYLEIVRRRDEAILRRDGDFRPNLATCCASIMAEPDLLQLCISLLAGFQKEKQYMQDANGVLFERVLRLRRTLFTFRKRVWTVAIVRGIGDMMAGQEPPPLTDFYSIGKGDDTHLVCGSVADIPASPSTSFKSYVVDDVFIAKTNVQIGGVLPPLVRRAYGQHDVCFIADGQSGSGKSYTLFNGPNALAPLIGRDILNTKRQGEYTLTCTALEVSQDGLKDLLGAEGSPTTGPPESRSPKGKKPRALVNHLSEPITSEAQLRSLLTQACQRRCVSATGANVVSSRGHMICTLTIESGTLASPESTRVVIVDLAGSERRRGESLTDDEKAETTFINNSRTEVRRALLALTKNQNPAKDSMLTKALASVLEKGSKFIMLAHLSPFASDHGRSVDMLNFCTEVSNRKSDLTPQEAETERGLQLGPWGDKEALWYE